MSRLSKAVVIYMATGIVWVIIRNAMAYSKGTINIVSILGDATLDGPFRVVLILATTVGPVFLWPIEVCMWSIVSMARQ